MTEFVIAAVERALGDGPAVNGRSQVVCPVCKQTVTRLVGERCELCHEVGF